MKNIILTISISFLICLNEICASEPPFLKFLNDPWVDTQMREMSLEEKIAQLMMLTAYPKQDEASRLKLLEQIKNFSPGGILVMQGTPVKTTEWINSFQENSKIPLLVAIDGEWGPAMRIDSILEYPSAQAIGAIHDTALIYQMGVDFGQQLKLMGIQMNFAPVADVNTNPANPVINFRSFGEDPVNVTEKAWFTAKGMQDAGVIPVAKHFPGHGDTHVDSHKTLPVLNHSKARLDSIETLPFRQLAQKGISGIMTAHLNVPSIDNSGTPSSLSSNIVTNYLKKEIGFSGLVVTDAINMQGVIRKEGNTELKALLAGNDLVEFVPDIRKAVKSIKNAVEKGEISLYEIEVKCRKILAAKRWANLNTYKPANINELSKKLNSPYYELTVRNLIKSSFTVLNNTDNILPVENLDSLKIASVVIDTTNVNHFQKMLDNYSNIDHFSISKTASEPELVNMLAKLQNYNLIILGVYGINNYPAGKYGTTDIQRKTVSEIIKRNNTVTVFLGNAYALKYFENIRQSTGLIMAYQNLPLTQELAAQLIFGAFEANGKLPVSVDMNFKAGDGLLLEKNNCLSYTIPEEIGINSEILKQKIDSIAMLGINAGAYPGCQVLVAKDGKVFFHKCYGFQTYEDSVPVEKGNLYDWASLTKVTGPLPALMKLVDENKIKTDDLFSKYWPDFKNSNKQNITIKEVLTHQAQLPTFINMWSMALNSDKTLNTQIFKNYPYDNFNIRVSQNLYMNSSFIKVMYDTIRDSKLRPQKKYEYSDLGFILFPEIISRLTGENYEDYIKKTFYHKMGAYSITYNPYNSYPLEYILPTERDDNFRKEVIHGFVHDENAAMMGGISGNAGLFGTTNDLAKLFQMYLQKGLYGGKRYISEKTVNEFISVQFPENNNRRGLGFDKPYLNNTGNSLRTTYPAISAGKNSFGHAGFTGTFAWADPDYGLVYIFMSNRIYPTRENQKISDLNIRSAIFQTVYDNVIKN
ncbi:MAG: serine hydrolase [Bacteroidales bacterium]|nr:serine hydrolase [Bacteroidales bacterium]